MTELLSNDNRPTPTEVIPLDRTSPLPLYEQLKRRLQSMVLSWPPSDDRFYTDQQLSDMFSVSRMTVRQAVQDLVDNGYLRRAPGSGTFICNPKVEESFSLTTDFFDQWADSGHMLELKTLHCATEPCSHYVAHQLAIPEGTPVWNVIRLRQLKHVPISMDYRFIPVSIIEYLNPRDIESMSLLDILSKHIELAYGKLIVESAAAAIDHADYLRLMPGDPILTRRLTYHDTDERPVMSGISYYRADQVRYSIHVPLLEEDIKKKAVQDKFEYKK